MKEYYYVVNRGLSNACVTVYFVEKTPVDFVLPIEILWGFAHKKETDAITVAKRLAELHGNVYATFDTYYKVKSEKAKSVQKQKKIR